MPACQISYIKFLFVLVQLGAKHKEKCTLQIVGTVSVHLIEK